VLDARAATDAVFDQAELLMARFFSQATSATCSALKASGKLSLSSQSG
jgi:hypothetical protein